jgi:hypothetical protein
VSAPTLECVERLAWMVHRGDGMTAAERAEAANLIRSCVPQEKKETGMCASQIFHVWAALMIGLSLLAIVGMFLCER